MRPRKLPPQVVEKDWEAVEKNASKLKSLFKRDFVSLSNDDDLATLKSKTKALFKSFGLSYILLIFYKIVHDICE